MGAARNEKTLDSTAVGEAVLLSCRYWAMGAIDDEKAFLSAVASIDALLGRSNTPQRTDAVVADRLRSPYLDGMISMMRESRLTLKELSDVLSEWVSARASDGGRAPYHGLSDVLLAAQAWCRNISYEPEWHMRRRGDDKRLPSSRGRDLWGYLRGLYTKPENARLRMPDTVRELAPMYPGYLECVERARRDGQAELRRLHGPEADLSLVSDRPRYDDPAMSSFLGGIRNGSVAGALKG